MTRPPQILPFWRATSCSAAAAAASGQMAKKTRQCGVLDCFEWASGIGKAYHYPDQSNGAGETHGMRLMI